MSALRETNTGNTGHLEMAGRFFKLKQNNMNTLNSITCILLALGLILNGYSDRKRHSESQLEYVTQINEIAVGTNQCIEYTKELAKHQLIVDDVIFRMDSVNKVWRAKVSAQEKEINSLRKDLENLSTGIIYHTNNERPRLTPLVH
jgi:hypothetical protein